MLYVSVDGSLWMKFSVLGVLCGRMIAFTHSLDAIVARMGRNTNRKIYGLWKSNKIQFRDFYTSVIFVGFTLIPFSTLHI